VLIPKALRERARQASVADMLVRPGRMRDSLGCRKKGEREGSAAGDGSGGDEDDNAGASKLSADEALMERRKTEDEAAQAARAGCRGIFEGVVVYVNGSTFPLVSDHKLKHLLSENGGQVSLHLGRRKVTHVILGRPAGAAAAASQFNRGGGPGRSGAGGGLAGGKLEREIKRIGGCGVKFVDVEWFVYPSLILPLLLVFYPSALLSHFPPMSNVLLCFKSSGSSLLLTLVFRRVLESLKVGKRLPEARFANVRVAARGQGSVYGRYAERVTPAAAGAASPRHDSPGERGPHFAK
jgi:hypothetical protein